MRVWAGIIVLALSLAMVLGVPSLARAGGAWPRGEGNVFVSLSYTTSGDLLGYAQAMQYRVPGIPVPEIASEIGTYIEYGLSERLTFGIDRYSRIANETGSTVLFIRANHSRPGWRSSYGAEVGFGIYKDWRMIEESILRVGLSWGRGFETRWMDGWVDIDAKITGASQTGSVLWKIDSTLGVKPGKRSLVYLQMQSGALDGFPTYTRAAPTYVMKLDHGISLETSVQVGIRNDDSQGVKIGAWIEF